jgi:hypothetical protein
MKGNTIDFFTMYSLQIPTCSHDDEERLEAVVVPEI